ncbi:MAG: CDP-2,3-bis-(O-geranylgeranyl)-sn-glycerol synthase [Candidatus Aenigmarchaeota archaeon]|nr:CDP-2,3-bis-(O-geranylgeranyl)-sn-glycerol synthase [Candidatus Aenigmarchaeota archaeon]NIP40811.1 CDP-2,3-bis-(O-geranylgeranyl)-sn-glycerol synthase [Candidatus Aenigmarchaeota archaeon]NIQ17925.1 CDP-2,3-bis-(O-geranylgeranyl)-sn-glycerol synthase [Candidatus Aenigmarchaeota archaeon]NIS73514.1 CDP-2,3-bis-(O-geranylgeranyl)-sn-glycerol synthase [Candidatus Aenigmarchaeota archaeon]
MIDIYTFVEAVWLLWPAYGANGLCMLARGKRSIDGGKTFRGKPVFGNGKTWEGFMLGVVIATLVGTFQMIVFPYLPWDLSPVALDIVPMSPFMGFVIGLGAMAGDLGGSFLKRRIGIPRGKPAPLLDQLDFIIGMLVFLAFVVALKWEWVVILVILTPVIHLVANGVAYLLRIKKVPY